MSTHSANRLATLRYAVLDECFTRDPNHQSGEPLPRYFKKDLLDLVNKRLKEAMPGTKPIAMRTLEKDIQDMQRIFGVRIVRYHEHKKAFYAYAQRGMTIRAAALTGAESARLTSAVEICNRFAGDEQRKWLPWALAILKYTFHLDEQAMRSRRNQTQASAWSIDPSLEFPGQVDIQRVLGGMPIGKWVAIQCVDGTSISFFTEHIHSAGRQQFLCGIERQLDAQGAEAILLRVLAWDEIRSVEALDNPAKSSAEQSPRNWAEWCRQRKEVRSGTWTSLETWDQSPDEVRIWFSEDRAAELHRIKWHPSQHPKTERAAGGEIFTFDLVTDEALISGVFREGMKAQLLEPLELRDTIRDIMGAWPRMYDAMFGP